MRKLPKCPKWKAWPSQYIEVWTEHTIAFDVDDNGRPEQEGWTDDGQPSHVIACCSSCRHKWRLRGVLQITELRSQEGGDA